MACSHRIEKFIVVVLIFLIYSVQCSLQQCNDSEFSGINRAEVQVAIIAGRAGSLNKESYLEEINSTFKRYILGNRSKNQRILQCYKFLEPMMLVEKVTDLTPEMVVRFMCDQVVPSNVNTLLYFVEDDIGDKSAVTTAFLLKFAESIGLPVIAHLQDDKSGLTQVSYTYVATGFFLFLRCKYEYYSDTNTGI